MEIHIANYIIFQFFFTNKFKVIAEIFNVYEHIRIPVPWDLLISLLCCSFKKTLAFIVLAQSYASVTQLK